MSKITVDACFSPYLYPVYRDDENIVVIIDILRATSAICTAFENGVEKIIPVATVEEARDYQSRGYIAAAEREAVPVEGFPFGNSPYSYMGDHVKGQTIVLTTTNGTQAINAAKDAHKVIIGAFTNISAVCDYLKSQERNVLLLCSGWKNKFNLEDALFAGAVTEELSKVEHVKLQDAALALKYLYQQAKEDPHKFLHNASHKERLARLGLKDDIKYCLQSDLTREIPVLENGALVRLKW
ncbi:MAG: 2-phosphosulfolactate phosphatase [Flavobacteriales bacterium]|nr:2-phosphosulfolactate phosphatase [Flavobacteriales bacterium]